VTPSAFVDAVFAERVVLVRGQVHELRDEDLALFTQRAGDERHVRAFGGVLRHGRAGSDALIVGMSVHEEQATVGRSHPAEGSSRR